MTPSRDRRLRLLEVLRAGEIDVDELSRRFQVSPSTVRRDLQRLSETKEITRTYGGAILAHPAAEESLNRRQTINSAQKTAIARAALSLLKDDDVLILDGGSTVAAFGRLLKGRRHRVITNNVALLQVFSEEPDIEVMLLGGTLRRTSMSTFGPLATMAMQRMTADKVFLGADGVVAGRGVCEASLDQISLKSLMMEQAREVIVLADSTKLSRAHQWTWAPLPQDWTLVTDWQVSEEHCDLFRSAGARIVRALAE